jgi:DNA-binding response OmpR family regulator
MRIAMRVLLIEHHQLMARPLKRGLEEEGFDVKIARGAGEVDPTLLDGTNDVIIMDLPIQEEDSLSLLQCWRHAGMNTPVLLLTADNEDEVMHTGLGVVNFLTKPFELEELFSRLRRLARQNN